LLTIGTLARGFRRAFWALVIALLLAGAGIVTFSVLSGNWHIAPILSGSMQPGFPVGGVVAAERMPMSDLAVGDVAIFQSPYDSSEQVVHRIVELNPDSSGQPVVKTRGDANAADDPWTITLQGNTIYVARFTLPLLGYPAVSTNHGIDLMIGGLILLLVVVSTFLGHQRDAADQKARTSVEVPGTAGVEARRPAIAAADEMKESHLAGDSRGGNPS
jgi:signal peptidase I, archaeal type